MGKLFNKKKEDAPEAQVHEVDDTRQVVNDFKLRVPWDSYRPIDYRTYAKLQGDAMIPMIDACLEKLLAGADDGNGDMLDQTVFSAVREAQTDLAKQRVNHRDLINRLGLRRKADREDFVRKRDEIKERLARLEDEHRKTLQQAEKYA